MKGIVRLKERGIALSPPASSEKISALKSHCDARVFDKLYDSIYRWFDGFLDDDFDEASFLRIWSIDRVIKTEKVSNIYPFMDFSLDSDIYGLSNIHGSKIIRCHSMAETSVNVDDLIEGIVNGRFDFGLGL